MRTDPTPRYPGASRPLTNLVVHDGTQTHDTHVDVILLTDDPRIPQGLPAVGRGQPGSGRGEAAGVRVLHQASHNYPPTPGTSGTFGN